MSLHTSIIHIAQLSGALAALPFSEHTCTQRAALLGALQMYAHQYGYASVAALQADAREQLLSVRPALVWELLSRTQKLDAGILLLDQFVGMLGGVPPPGPPGPGLGPAPPGSHC